MTTDTAPDPVARPLLRAPVRTSRLLHRWPTLLALALAALLLLDPGDGTENALLLLVTAQTYLVLAVVRRPTATWPVLLAVLGGVVAAQAAGDVGPVLIAAAVVLLAGVGLVTGAFRRGARLGLAQAPAAVVFTGAGLLGTGVDPGLGVVVVAAGLVLHAVWDAVHWYADRLVQRSFAEWCGVLDLSVGVGLLVLV